MCNQIPKFLLLGLGDNVLGIYWINNEECFAKISQVNSAFYKYETFKELYQEAFDEFSGVNSIISDMSYEDDVLMSISADFQDDFLDVLSFSRFEKIYFEVPNVLKRMTKALTNAGELTRHDL
ncbi:hypothetical protein B9Z52_10670 [Limnohabitans sp. Jir72]|nr:hypothetical protein B9Z52_10670 [Limnohabitans sp. Jir72]